MSQFIMDWLRSEPIEFRDFAIIAVEIFCFGIVFAAIGFVQLGKLAGGAMFTRTYTIREHGLFASAVKMSVFVLGEECLYRYLGLELCIRLFENEWMVLSTALIISLGFGFAPPHNVLPLKTRLAVALGGFLLSLLYLKCGGWQAGNPMKPLLIVFAAHLWVSGIIVVTFWYYRPDSTQEK